MTTAPAPDAPKRFSLARLFLAGCIAVMASAMTLVGNWVESRIEQAAVQNSANAAALYMESFVSPLSQDLAEYDVLPSPAARALVEIFENTPIGDRISAYRIWKPGGTIAHASNPDEIGRNLVEPPQMDRVTEGAVLGALLLPEGMDQPQLAVFSPIRELWSGEIVAVAEFYVRSDALLAELTVARRESWIVVSATFTISALALFAIVLAGDRLIRAQALELEDRVRQSETMAALNRDLRARALEASARATAQADRLLRRLGSDLHDGPAQYLALAALRLDSVLGRDGAAAAAEGGEIRKAIDSALAELRALSRGLVMPDIDSLSLNQVIQRAVAGNRALAEASITVDGPGTPEPPLDYAAKLCVYRFLQETLSNVARHAPSSECRVTCRTGAGRLRVEVADDGPGFTPETAMRMRADGGQGLMGLYDRAESLGGEVGVASAPGRGTRVTLDMPIAREEPA